MDLEQLESLIDEYIAQVPEKEDERMKLETELDFVRMWQEEQMKMLEAKQADYADPKDVLWNFRARHDLMAILDIEPAQRECDVYLGDVVLKLQRACNLLHADRPPANEPVDDTLGDMINYITLLRLYLAGQRPYMGEGSEELIGVI